MSKFKEKIDTCMNDDYKFLSSGGYGSVYTNGKYIVKIYHERISFGVMNPSLAMPYAKQYILMKKCHDIKRTNLPISLIFRGHNMVGIKSLYTPGDTLLKLMKNNCLSEKDKYIITRDLVLASEELTNHRIYCLDYKLDNVIYDKDSKKASFIDMDDDLSKYCLIKHVLFKKIVLESLRNIILSLNVDNFERCFDKKINAEKLKDYPSELELCNKSGLTYDDLKSYVKKKEII